MTRTGGRASQALDHGRSFLEACVTVLSIDTFWSVWLTAIIVVEVALTVIFPTLFATGPFALAAYLCGAGLMSAAYATSLELAASFRERKARNHAGQRETVQQRRDRESSAPKGETMIPGAIGLALAALGAFLFIALARRDMVIFLIGLPVALVTAPLFSLFAFGYARGEPTIGSFAYRKMPWGLGSFLVLTGLVLAIRNLHLMDGERAVCVSMIAVAAGTAALGFNFYRNWRVRS